MQWFSGVCGIVLCILFVANATAMPQNGPQLLEQAGFDVALLDQVRNRTLQAFAPEENELFGQLVAAIVKLEANPPAWPTQPFDLMTALKKPQDYQGSYIELRGTVRRVTPMQITSTRLQELTGKSEYYHVDFFVSTDKTSFQLSDGEGEVVISGTYGITLLLFELPDAMRGANQNASIALPGFFLKNWLHKTAETRSVSGELRRPNPIVFGIGSAAQVVDVQAARRGIDALIGWFWGAAIALVVMLGFWQWRSNAARKNRQARRTAENPVDLTHLD